MRRLQIKGAGKDNETTYAPIVLGRASIQQQALPSARRARLTAVTVPHFRIQLTLTVVG